MFLIEQNELFFGFDEKMNAETFAFSGSRRRETRGILLFKYRSCLQRLSERRVSSISKGPADRFFQNRTAGNAKTGALLERMKQRWNEVAEKSPEQIEPSFREVFSERKNRQGKWRGDKETAPQAQNTQRALKMAERGVYYFSTEAVSF